ncbi:glycosyltransferase family 2 protein [Clostridium perfringens]|nr:glycosyltransferase family 2 protein [Clostridium perfringens]
MIRPKVSIITPAYNSEKYIEQTILSIINQSYENIQYIIIDGKSTDKTLEIINKYKEKIDLIVSEKDNGMYDAINKGLKLADGDIIAYLNSDDIYNDNKVIEKVVEIFVENKEIDWIYSDFYSIDEDSNILELFKIPNVNYKEFFASNWSYIPQPTTFWRKKIIKNGVNFDCDYKMAADYKFFLELIKNYKYKKVDFIVAKFRVHKESLSTNGQKLSIEEMNEIKKMENYNLLYDLFKFSFFIKYKFVNIKIYIKRLIKW